MKLLYIVTLYTVYILYALVIVSKLHCYCLSVYRTMQYAYAEVQLYCTTDAQNYIIIANGYSTYAAYSDGSVSTLLAEQRKKERKKKKGNTQLVIRPTKYCFLLYLKRFAVQ